MNMLNMTINNERAKKYGIIHLILQISKRILVDSAFHPFEVYKIKARNIWELSGKKSAPLKWL